MSRIQFSVTVLMVCICFFSCGSLPRPVTMLRESEYWQQPRTGSYVLQMESQSGCLMYFGARHTVNESSPQMTEIERRWDSFRPTMAFSEGCVWPLESTREEAIRKHGEQGLLRYLAARDHVPILCIEPCPRNEAAFLFRKFSAKQIKLFYVLRQAVVQNMLNRDPRDTGYVRIILEKLSAIQFLKAPPATLADVEREVVRQFPELPDWRKIPENYFYGPEETSWLSKIHRMVNECRDRHMVSRLFSELKKGKRVFALVGRSHVAIQEPALTVFLKELKNATLIVYQSSADRRISGNDSDRMGISSVFEFSALSSSGEMAKQAPAENKTGR